MTNERSGADRTDEQPAAKRPRLGLKYGAEPSSTRPLPPAGGRR